MKNRLVSIGFLAILFVGLATLATNSGSLSNLVAQTNSSANNTESASVGNNSTSEENKTTSTGLGSSIPTPSITGNGSSGTNGTN
jgi:hypothetical protein